MKYRPPTSQERTTTVALLLIGTVPAGILLLGWALAHLLLALWS